jgi:hypothetical protein
MNQQQDRRQLESEFSISTHVPGESMNKLLSYGFATSMFAGVAVIGSAATSDARAVPAFLGQPQAPTDYSCFTNSNGIVTNRCTPTKQFCIALPVDGALHALTIMVFAPDASHSVSCFGQAGNRDNSIAGFTGTFFPSRVGVSWPITLPTLSVPSQGNLFACCNVAQSASIESINY